MLNYKRIIFFCVFIYFPQIALSDDTHYKDMLFGGRAAGMGGAYIAISDDTSGCFYNPAGTVYAYEDSISGSGNAFYIQNYKIGEIKSPLGDETDSYDRIGESFLANFIGILRKNNAYTSCFVYLIPETVSEHQFNNYEINDKKFEYEIDWNLEDTSYLAGPSLASSLSNEISWGLGIYYHYRTGRFNQSEHTKLDLDSDGLGDTYGNLFHRGEFKEHGILYKLGLQWSPVNEIVFGIVLDQLIIYRSLYTKNSSYTFHNWIFAHGFSGGNLSSSEDDSKRSIPSHLGFGFAYYPSPSTLYALDLDFYNSIRTNIPFGFPNINDNSILPFSEPVPDHDDYQVIQKSSPQSIDLNQIYNISLGIETYVNEGNSFAFGLYTNNTSAPDPGESNVFYYDHIDMNGLSMAYSSHTINSTFSIGLVITKGEGNLVVNHFLPRKINTYPVSRNSMSLFIAVN